MLHSFKCEVCGSDFQRKWLNARFCSVECQNQWQKNTKWEDRIGDAAAEKIRSQTSLRFAGDNNPTKNPEIAHKVSESLKRYLEEQDRSGERNPFYGKHHTDEFKQKHSENKKGKWAYNDEQYQKLCENTPKGEQHPNWRGGISQLPYAFGFDKKLKEQVKQKYGCKCVICNEIGKKLCSHHIDYDKNNNAIENLVPLCQSCHSKTNYNRESWIAFFKAFKENDCE